MKTHPKSAFFVVISLIHIYGIQAQNISALSRQHEFIKKSVYRIAVQSFQNRPVETESAYLPTLKLDSIIWDAYWADSGHYKGCEKWTFHYNELLDATSATYYWYNYIEDKYLPGYKMDFSYNEDHTPKEGIIYQWDQGWNTGWIKFSKLNYTYDSKENLKEMKYFMWQDLFQQWWEFVKYDYNYDSADNKINVIGAFYINEQTWMDISREEFTYDSINRLRFHEVFFRTDTASSWLKEESEEYIYDTNGYTIFSNEYIWDIDILINIYKGKHIYSFDENHNLSSYIQYSWDESDNLWIYVRRKIYTYDNAYDRNALLIPSNQLLNENAIINDFNFDFFDHMLTDMKSDLYSFDEWIPDYKGKFYYSELIQTGIADPDFVSVVVYPNPADDYISFHWGGCPKKLNLVVYNIYGKMVFNQNVEEDSKLSVDRFVQGIYVILLKDSNTVIHTSKIIVQ
jgi:hypothetical protein